MAKTKKSRKPMSLAESYRRRKYREARRARGANTLNWPSRPRRVGKVIVKSLATGEVRAVVDQSAFTRQGTVSVVRSGTGRTPNNTYKGNR